MSGRNHFYPLSKLTPLLPFVPIIKTSPATPDREDTPDREVSPDQKSIADQKVTNDHKVMSDQNVTADQENPFRKTVTKALLFSFSISTSVFCTNLIAANAEKTGAQTENITVADRSLNENNKPITPSQLSTSPHLALQATGSQKMGFIKDVYFDFAVLNENHTGHFDWSIASDMSGTRSPNVLSELVYKDLEISALHYQTAARLQFNNDFTGLIELNLTQGTVDTGNVYDADFLENDKTNPKSLSQSNPSGSGLQGIEFALGIQRAITPATQMALLFGVREHRQKFIKREGFQVFAADSTNVPARGTTFTQLNSSYQTRWESGFLGAQLQHKFGRRQLEWRLDYHRALYYAEADWNLRSTFQHPKSFEHSANGSGLVSALTYRHPLYEHLFLTFSLHYEHWQTRNGVDRLFLANGNETTTRLIETNWERQGYGLGIIYQGGL